jgi:hypothetical protein
MAGVFSKLSIRIVYIKIYFPCDCIIISCILLVSNSLVSCAMDLFPNEQNFDPDKSRQKFHHSVEEHHKISNIPKFRCEML